MNFSSFELQMKQAVAKVANSEIKAVFQKAFGDKFGS